MGQQFTRIVDSATKDLLMPLLNALAPKGSFENLKLTISAAPSRLGS
nr:hypothetical protein [Synechococcus sp. UW106]